MCPIAARGLLSLILLSFACPWCRADSTVGSSERVYTLKAWETDDGLPHNSVASVVQRKDGFLWIATQGGLVRFDGLQFTPFHSPLIDGINSSSVVALVEDDAETLLVASIQSGLLQLKFGELSVHPLTALFRENQKIAQMFKEADHVFWVVFADREVWRWENGEVQKFAAPPSQRTFWPASFAHTETGDVYIARGYGVEKWVSGALIRVPEIAATTVAVGASRQGGLWVAEGRQLGRLAGGKFAVVANPAPWPSASPPSIVYEDRSGVLWLGSRDQPLLHWKDGAAGSVTTSHLRVSDILEDDEGNLWVATGGGGLDCLQQPRLRIVAEESNWTTDVAGSICEDQKGDLWFANRKGVRKITRGEVGTFEAAGKAWPRRTIPICAVNSGDLWCGSGSDLYRINPDNSTRATLVDSSEGAAIHVLFAARDGSVWVGRSSGPLQRFHSDHGESLGAELGFTGGAVHAMSEDRDGQLWVGTLQGHVFALRENRFVEYNESNGLPGNEIRAIHADHEGRLWIGTAGAGVFALVNGRFLGVSENQGLTDSVVSQILEDDYGWLWFGSRRGIFKVQKTNLYACAIGERMTVTPIAYGREDGVSGVSALGSYQPTAVKTRDGHLWFATRKGLVTTDPARHEDDRRLPRVYLDRVLVDNRTFGASPVRAFSSMRKLEFQFTAPTYLAPEKVRFRYRLDGFDRDWTEGGTRRFASYPALRPGRYLFQVTASNGDLAWSPDAATLAVEILPMWWETWWARLAGVSAGAFLLIAIVRYRSHQKLKQQVARLEQDQKMEAERARIARDLHDDLGASLTRASMMADELSEEWGMNDGKAQTSRLAKLVRRIAGDLDAVVWTVSPSNDRLSSLAAYLCEFTEEYFRESPILCQVFAAQDISEQVVSPELRHHVFMIAKELFNNVLKHSRATRVEFTMKVEENDFVLTVRDDGHGFTPEDAVRPGHDGLRNIRTRAKEAGLEIDFRSSSAGTVVTLTVPITKERFLGSISHEHPT